MNFLELQPTIASLIARSPTFAANAAVVFADSGTVKKEKEAALDLDNNPPGPGFNIAVWPPTRGNASGDPCGVEGVDAGVVVRLEVNPKSLPGNPIDAAFCINTMTTKIVEAVLGAAPEAGGVTFQLASDAFELVNFDEGLIAYHIRFVRFCVWGVGN